MYILIDIVIRIKIIQLTILKLLYKYFKSVFTRIIKKKKKK